MTAAFRRRVRASLADASLQQALDNNAERRRQARDQGLASVDDLTATKSAARSARQAMLTRMPEVVETFTARARANGFTVHVAGDAEHARQIVLGIARDHAARLVAKSKSMLSEEIRLNPHLEAAGLRVVETDLGEFIVQLRGEPPAHIITPAIHLRREDVARTFVDRLGMSFTTDVGEMTATARRVLRQVFLTSDIGISGANFAVAETGSLCLVTNEGNGRMVTTVPPVHIALLGMERLVPRLQDLAPLLALLPRSATGQAITSYVSLIQAPRADGDADGPRERHVILIDNGRRALARSALAESLLCIRCGACLNVCPVYQEAGGHAYASPYPGPIGAVVSPGLFGVEAYGHLAKASSLCGACEEACPIGIDLPEMLLRLRSMSAEQGHQPRMAGWAMRAFAWASARPDRLAALQSLAAWFVGALATRDDWSRWLPPPVSAWTTTRDFPKPARRTFRHRWKSRTASGADPDGPRLVATPLPARASPPDVASASSTMPGDLIGEFSRRLEGVGGEVHTCVSGELIPLVERILEQLGARSILLAQGSPPLDASLATVLEGRGMTCLPASLPIEAARRTECLPQLDTADAGVCAALAGLADTGTVVVGSGPEGDLLASLLPPAAIVILPAGGIHTGLSAWLRTSGSSHLQSHSSVSLVTGPSRTADIEMTLTMGVHGPGRWIVVIVRSAPD